MVVEDDYNIVEVGTAQGFTKIVEPKRERADPASILPHASRGQGVGGGASQGRPQRGGSHGCVTIPPIVEDLGVKDDDNEFPGDPHDEEEDEVQFNYPDEEDDDNEDEEDDDDEVQVVT